MARISAKEKAAARWGLKDNQRAKKDTPVRELTNIERERELLEQVRQLIELAEYGCTPDD